MSNLFELHTNENEIFHFQVLKYYIEPTSDGTLQKKGKVRHCFW